MTNKYYQATICIKGHVDSHYYKSTQPFCSECGSETISSCQSCGEEIHGYYDDGFFGKKYIKPNYCHNCGKPYPWTQLILENAVELVALDENLSNEAKEIIRKSIPDLIIETPTTPVAVAKYKINIVKASKVVKDALYQLLLDVVSEATMKTLYPES